MAPIRPRWDDTYDSLPRLRTVNNTDYNPHPESPLLLPQNRSPRRGEIEHGDIVQEINLWFFGVIALACFMAAALLIAWTWRMWVPVQQALRDTVGW